MSGNLPPRRAPGRSSSSKSTRSANKSQKGKSKSGSKFGLIAGLAGGVLALLLIGFVGVPALNAILNTNSATPSGTSGAGFSGSAAPSGPAPGISLRLPGSTLVTARSQFKSDSNPSVGRPTPSTSPLQAYSTSSNTPRRSVSFTPISPQIQATAKGTRRSSGSRAGTATPSAMSGHRRLQTTIRPPASIARPESS